MRRMKPLKVSLYVLIFSHKQVIFKFSSQAYKTQTCEQNKKRTENNTRGKNMKGKQSSLYTRPRH